MKSCFLSTCLIFLLVGCATTKSPKAEKILETDNTEMKQRKCHPLGEVNGASGLNGPLTLSTGKQNAKNEALSQAVTKGATHIVWKELDPGFFGIKASADAYLCE